MLRTLLKVDYFRVLQDREQTLTPATERGGYLSLVCLTLIAMGVLNEAAIFFARDWRSTMAISSHSLEMETVHFNVTFDNWPCAAIAFEAIEATTGRIYEEQQKTAVVRRYRMLPGSNIVLGLHDTAARGGVEADVTNENGEGCRVVGTFDIDKIPGHFILTAKHLSPHNRPPMDFTIHELWFGKERLNTRDVPEALANALGGFRAEKQPSNSLYQFFVNIVPTSFEDGRLGFQYTWQQSHVQADIPPGLYFHHVHSPLSVMYHRSRTTWSHFLTNLCAVVGGVFTVVGFGSAFTHKAAELFSRSKEMFSPRGNRE